MEVTNTVREVMMVADVMNMIEEVMMNGEVMNIVVEVMGHTGEKPFCFCMCVVSELWRLGPFSSMET